MGEPAITMCGLSHLPVADKRYIFEHLSFPRGGFQALVKRGHYLGYESPIIYRFENSRITSWAAIAPTNLNEGRCLMAFTDYPFRRKGFASHLIRRLLNEARPSTLAVCSKTLAKILDKLDHPYVYYEWWIISK